MALNVARNDSPQGADEVVHLPRVGASDRISNPNTSDSDLVDSTVDGEEVDEVGTERVLGRESDFETLGLDKLDDLDGRLDDEGDVLAVRVLAEEGRRSNDNVDSVDTWRTSSRPPG